MYTGRQAAFITCGSTRYQCSTVNTIYLLYKRRTSCKNHVSHARQAKWFGQAGWSGQKHDSLSEAILTLYDHLTCVTAFFKHYCLNSALKQKPYKSRLTAILYGIIQYVFKN